MKIKCGLVYPNDIKIALSLSLEMPKLGGDLVI